MRDQGYDAAAGRSGGDGLGERRVGEDRRRFSWRTLVQGSLTPRRRSARRDNERHGLIDWHEPHLLFAAVTILLLSVYDALLTLTLMQHGAHEANPVMAVLLNEHPRWFAAGKMGLTGIGIIVLVVLARARVFRVVKVALIIHLCFLVYVGLIAYELRLLDRSF